MLTMADAQEAVPQAATKEVFKVLSDAISHKLVEEKHGINHCRLKNGIITPSLDQVNEAVVMLTDIRDRVKKYGDVEVKSVFVQLAMEKEIKRIDQKAVVCNFSELTGRWKQHSSMTLQLCKQLYEITVEHHTSDSDWLPSVANRMKCNLHLDIEGTNKGKYGNFIEEIIMEICHLSIRKFTYLGRGANTKVGLTQKKDKNHPMGPPQKGITQFQYQNVSGWTDLCAVDPVARSINQEYNSGQSKTNETIQEAIDRHTQLVNERVNTVPETNGPPSVVSVRQNAVHASTSSIASSRLTSSQLVSTNSMASSSNHASSRMGMASKGIRIETSAVVPERQQATRVTIGMAAASSDVQQLGPLLNPPVAVSRQEETDELSTMYQGSTVLTEVIILGSLSLQI